MELNGKLSPSRIVCAAVQHANGLIVTSPRHFDLITKLIIVSLKSDRKWHDARQGFVDQHGIFFTREAAYEIAEKNNQIIRECGNPGERVLYSEHLY